MTKSKILHILFKHILPLLLGILMLTVSMLVNFTEKTRNILYIFSLLFISYDIILYSVRDIFIDNTLNENIFVLFCILVTYFMKYYSLCFVIATLFKLCYFIRDIYSKPFKKNIFNLLECMPKTATISINKVLMNEAPENISIGNTILVSPDEIIPLDGIVISGESSVNEYKLTGNVEPRNISVHDEVLNGSINLDSPIIVKVTREFISSTIIKIKNSISNGIGVKSKKISTTNKIINIYITTLIFVPLSILFTLPFFIKDFQIMPHAITAVNYILVLSPLALMLNLYISYFIIIKGLQKQGVYVRDNTTLENLSNVGTIIIDESFIDTPKDIDTLDKFENYILTSLEEISGEIKSKSSIEIIILKHFTDDDNYSTTKLEANNLNISIISCLQLPFIRSKILRDIMKNKKSDSNVVFIGNGIQNIHLLSMADIGISAKSDIDSDVVNIASDISIGDGIKNSYTVTGMKNLMEFSKTSKKILLQNFLFCTAGKALALGIYQFTNISILSILFIEILSCMLIVFNCISLIRKK